MDRDREEKLFPAARESTLVEKYQSQQELLEALKRRNNLLSERTDYLKQELERVIGPLTWPEDRPKAMSSEEGFPEPRHERR